MSYCTVADIRAVMEEAELIQLSDDIHAGVADSEVIDRAIEDAAAVIDAHCQSRYTVPLSPVPAMIRQAAAAIAAYKLYVRRSMEVPGSRAEEYKAMMRFLEKVAEGKISLGAAGTIPSGGDAVEMESGGRVFGRDDSTGYI